MTAEISLGDIPIPTQTQDPVFKQIFQLENQPVIGDKPNKANIQIEKVPVELDNNASNMHSTPKTMKQV